MFSQSLLTLKQELLPPKKNQLISEITNYTNLEVNSSKFCLPTKKNVLVLFLVQGIVLMFLTVSITPKNPWSIPLLLISQRKQNIINHFHTLIH